MNITNKKKSSNPKRRKIVTVLIIVVLAFVLVCPVRFPLCVNGEKIPDAHVTLLRPYYIIGEMSVPLLLIASELGAEITWVDDNIAEIVCPNGLFILNKNDFTLLQEGGDGRNLLNMLVGCTGIFEPFTRTRIVDHEVYMEYFALIGVMEEMGYKIQRSIHVRTWSVNIQLIEDDPVKAS